MARRRVPRGLLFALLVLVGLGGSIALGAIIPLEEDDSTPVRAWKLGSVRLAIGAVAVAVSRADGALAPLEGEPFEESVLHPYLARVRRDPRTRHFYGKGRLDLADYAAMADFLRTEFRHGLPAGWHYSFHVLEMLDAADEGAELACGGISRMLIQLVQAGGGYGRRVQLTNHVVAELWSREHEKWVAVDADYDVYFTDAGGTPLSVWEIHQRVRDGRRGDLVPHVGASPTALFRERPETLYAAYEEGFAVEYYARWVSRNLPTWHPSRNPSHSARVYYPDATLDQRLYFRHHIDDPETLYDPPAGAQAASKPGVEAGP